MPVPIILGAIKAGLGGMMGLGTALNMGGALLGYKGQKDTNEANVKLGREQMEFQAEQADIARDYMREMSGTAYQRAMKDMKDAGLNPILAYSQGGASTPSSPAMAGAMPVMQNPMAAGANVGTQIMNSASNIATQASQREKIDAEVKVLGEQAGLTNNQIHKVQVELDKIRKETDNIAAQTEGRELENVQTKMLTDFYQSAEFARIAKDIGINPSTLKSIFVAIFGAKGNRK